MDHPTDANIAPESPDTRLLNEIPDLWFELPPGFTEFDLAEDAEARMLRMAESVEAVFTGATPAQRFSLVVSGEYILQTMIAAGAEHISSCLLRMPEDELSQGTLCVIVERPDVGPQNQDRQGTARRTAAQWRELYPDAEIGLVMLPYGISALCIRDQRLNVPGAFFGLDAPVPSTVRQAQFCVPLKTGPGSALFVFMTEDLKHWTDYLEVFSVIMKSVSTDEPLTEQVSVADRTEGLG
ncbi:hypothetical protein B9W68_18135 [Streptomyces sp. CS227]|uniref:hypothetical protein n=1 Tax=Streptomyces sp. CS227 TaxID=1982763 RepID=UPI000B416276|nr:hypothetical protein [Streptomyces sp. CS227]OWA06384.1 hypothetical protein B9W68_18135 [Streptomyces sp. CS227]